MLTKIVAVKLKDTQRIKNEVKEECLQFRKDIKDAHFIGKIKVVVNKINDVVKRVKWWYKAGVLVATLVLFFPKAYYFFNPEAKLAKDFNESNIELLELKAKLAQNKLDLDRLLKTERFKKLTIAEVYETCYTGDEDDLSRDIFLKIFGNDELGDELAYIWDILNGKPLPKIDQENYEKYIIIKFFIMDQKLKTREEEDFFASQTTSDVDDLIVQLTALKDKKITSAQVNLREESEYLRPLLTPVVGSINPDFDGRPVL